MIQEKLLKTGGFRLQTRGKIHAIQERHKWLFFSYWRNVVTSPSFEGIEMAAKAILKNAMGYEIA